MAISHVLGNSLPVVMRHGFVSFSLTCGRALWLALTWSLTGVCKDACGLKPGRLMPLIIFDFNTFVSSLGFNLRNVHLVWSTCWVKGGLYDDPSKVKCFGSRVLGG